MWQESLRYPLDGQRSLRGKWWGVRTIWSKEQKATRGAIRGKGSSWSLLGPLGPSCSLTVSLTLICFSHHILVILHLQHRAAHPLPGFIQVDLFGLAWDRIHVQPGCPGVMAPVLGSERDGCGLASGNVHLGGQLRSHRNRGYSQRTSRVNGSLRLTLTGFRASHT